MANIEEKLKEHEWEIVHFMYNNTLYMDGAYIGDFVRNNHISDTIYGIAKHINRTMEDFPRYEVVVNHNEINKELPFN